MTQRRLSDARGTFKEIVGIKQKMKKVQKRYASQENLKYEDLV